MYWHLPSGKIETLTSDTTHILSTLKTIQQRRSRITACDHQGSYAFSTCLLKIDESVLILDSPYNHQRITELSNAEKIHFICGTQSAPLRFDSQQLTELDYQGQRAFQIPLPSQILRYQRRRSLRLPLESAHVKLPNHQPGLNFNPVDISSHGIGLAAEHNHLLEIGDIIPNSQIQLSPEQPTMRAKLRICSSELVNQTNKQFRRYGAEFIELDSAASQLLAAYLDDTNSM